MSGAVTPASSMRRLIAGTAAAASGMLTVILTSSEPACASSMHCCAVDATSGVSVFVIDCTATGAPPPTCTAPTFTPTVLWSLIVGIYEIRKKRVRPHFILRLGVLPERDHQAGKRTDARTGGDDPGKIQRI